MKYTVPRGTRDLLPEQAEVFRHMEVTAAELARIYGYHELRTPMFEHSELFERGVGESTDIVEKEMYTFSDRGERSLTLRPEGTAPVVRAVVEHKLYNGPMPLKLFYWGPMFRYERPQAGRYRQFWQFGIEMFGAEGPRADVEVIALGWRWFQQLGIETELVMNSIGCPECRAQYRQVLIEYLRKQELCANCVGRIDRNPLRVLDCKHKECQRRLEQAPLISEHLCQPCADHFQAVQTGLDQLEISYRLDGRLVRGLDYYNRTTFEYKTKELGAQDALGGGGRYDGLVELLGGPTVPAVGFALGVDRIELLCSASAGAETPRSGLFLVATGETTKKADQWLYSLREQGVAVQADLLERSFKAQFKQADRNNCRYALIFGPDELARGEAEVRDLETGKQTAVALEKLTEHILALEGVK
ncbi:MAG: histidine--tRNA ligase [Firmicutes bacterium]|nr:histidine--tRNA ligase [Bacillota bacterium]